MSKALTQAGPLKPEIRLAQAISDFEKDLSTKDKATVQAQREISPTIDDVMRLTAKIDKDISSTGVKRVYGPRLTNFLEGVQKFVPLGDSLVGGTQGYLGRSIWTVVRFAVLSTTSGIIQHSAYIEKLTNTFMEAGRSMPRYQSMARLFPHSTALRTYLIEYFIVVVKLCHKLMTMFKGSAFTQLLESYSNSLDTFGTQLQSWATAIKDELDIQAVTLLKHEKEENVKSRAISQKDRKEREAQRKEKTRLHLLDCLSTHDHQTLWKQTRKEGNTTLFTGDEGYQHWKAGVDSCTHVFSGKLGSGKSVLLANVISDLYFDLESDKGQIAYFFCHHRIKDSLKARTIAGSLTRQLLQANVDIEGFFSSDTSSASALEIDDITRIWKMAFLGKSKSIYLVVDGLDECEQTERAKVLEFIGDLQQSLKILLCTSMRWEADKTAKVYLAHVKPPSVTQIPEDNPEITAFIASQIDKNVSSGTLMIVFEDIVPIIKRVLGSKSQGMFLWASLAIKAICGLSSDEEIIQALEDLPLPEKLPDLYLRLLKKSSDSYKSYQDAILQLVTIAVRPLTVKELREALSVEPGNTKWNGLKLVSNMSNILACCGGLIIVDEEELTVRLVHDSARQFLMETGQTDAYRFLKTTAETKMAQIATTYLNYVVFETRISTTIVPKIDAQPIVQSVVGSAMNSSNLLGSLARRFGKKESKMDTDISRTLAETAMRARATAVLNRDFEAYARCYWFEHSAAALNTDPLTRELVDQLLAKELEIKIDHEIIEHALVWATTNGYSTALQVMLGNESFMAVHSRFLDLDFLKSLCLASEKGDGKVLNAYLDSEDSVLKMKDLFRNSALFDELWQRPALKKEYEIVRTLLAKDALTHLALAKAYHLLCNFLGQNTESIFSDGLVYEIFVTSGKVNLKNPGGDKHITPLQQAVRSNSPQIVQVLLDHGVLDPTPRKLAELMTAVYYAASNNYLEVLELLLQDDDAGLLVHSASLHIAAECGYLGVCQMLIDSASLRHVIDDTTLPQAGMNLIDSMTKTNETPLLLAAKHGHRDIVSLLLFRIWPAKKQAHVLRRDIHGRTALSWAAEKGHYRIVKMLLESAPSAGQSLKCHSGRTPLSYAASSGNEDCVITLLKDVSIWFLDEHTDDKGLTPLDYCGEAWSNLHIRRRLSSCMRSSEENVERERKKQQAIHHKTFYGGKSSVDADSKTKDKDSEGGHNEPSNDYQSDPNDASFSKLSAASDKIQ